MMTVPMDNGPAPASREFVQRLLKKNIELENKRRKSAQARIPSDPNAWQQMRENYETIILEDHDFSEQHEIEYALWQLHYRRIEELRAHFSAALASNGSAATQSGKSPARPDRVKKIRSQFKTFLSEATGFYHDLILKIRAKYGLPLDHFPEDVENLVIVEKDGKKSSEMKKGLLSCHRCLIYLGDLARYKGLYGEGDSKTRDYVAASSYYMQAASLLPSSGNPHHQLAILASYSGDELVAVYRYFRSLAVNCPFSTARDNLIIAFEKNRQNYSLLPGDANLSLVKSVPARKAGKGRGKGETVFTEDLKLEVNSVKGATSINETYKAFSVRFVRLNGILFTRTSLETLEEVFSLVISDLHLLLSSGPVEEMNFGSDSAENGLVMVRLIAILIFTVHNVNRETEGQSYAEILQRSVLLQNAFTAAFRFVGFILERCLQLQDPSSSFLLPGILVFIEWLACRPDMAISNDAEEKEVTARSFFWKHCVSFLNTLVLTRFASNVDDEDENCFFNMSRYDESETGNRLALWEDFELRGFLPLVPAQLILDFSRKHTNVSDGGNKEKRARIQRILAAGRALTNIVQIDQKGICFDQKLKKFTIGHESQISDITSANSMPQESPVDKIKNIRVLPPKEQVHAEGEEEDEVIVFKPTVLDKLGDVIAPKLATCEGLGHVEKASKAEWESYVGPISTPLSCSGLQNVFDSSNPALASLADKPPQQLQPMNPVSSTWLMEQENSFSNGIQNISIYGNGLTMSSSLQDGFGSSQPPAFSHPVPHSAKLATGFILPNHSLALETEIPSKFDSIMSLGTTAESLTTKTSITSSTSLRKNPVSRPARHHGPPPGFSPLPPKTGDELMVGSDSKQDNPPVDDYSWLDGYQLPLSTKGMAVSNSVNHVTPVYPHVMSNSSSLTDTINFPFPGKQAPSMQVQGENQKTWQDYQLLEHLKLYQEQQQQFQQAHQRSAPLPEQYQGQTLWPGRFFV